MAIITTTINLNIPQLHPHKTRPRPLHLISSHLVFDPPHSSVPPHGAVALGQGSYEVAHPVHRTPHVGHQGHAARQQSVAEVVQKRPVQRLELGVLQGEGEGIFQLLLICQVRLQRGGEGGERGGRVGEQAKQIKQWEYEMSATHIASFK